MAKNSGWDKSIYGDYEGGSDGSCQRNDGTPAPMSDSSSEVWDGAKGSLKQSNPDTPAYSRDFDGAGKERSNSDGRRPAKANE